MTIIQMYEERQSNLHEKLLKGGASGEDMMLLQELNYRISVLRTMQEFCLSAPISTDVKVLGFHYQLLAAYIHYVAGERRFGPRVDEAGAKKRETAAAALTQIIGDTGRRFASFHATGETQYKEAIGNMVNTVLPAWVQLRDTYINIAK